MKIERGVWQPIVFIAAINFILIVVMLMMSTSIMATPVGVAMNLSTPTRINYQAETLDLRVTAENVIYVNDKVVTLNELRRLLASSKLRGGIINIRADKQASVGRVMDILNLCQGIKQGQVNVANLE